MHLITIAALLGILLVSGCNQPATVADPVKDLPNISADEYRKELEEIKKGIRTETKIKLKKDAKGSYSWEIQGKDAQEILRVNETFRKKLGE